MFDYIKEKNLTIFTNSMEFIVRALPFEQLNVISIGGVLDRKTDSFGNPLNLDLLSNYNVKKAFMASTGISLSSGVTNASPLESELKKLIVKKVQKSIYWLTTINLINMV